MALGSCAQAQTDIFCPQKSADAVAAAEPAVDGLPLRAKCSAKDGAI